PFSSNTHLRLVKKFPGQPPSGAMVPSAAPGVAPKFMAHPPVPGAVRVHRPAMFTGGGGRGPPVPGLASGLMVTGPVGAAGSGSVWVLGLLLLLPSPPKLMRSAQAGSDPTSDTMARRRRAVRTSPVDRDPRTIISLHRRNDELGSF